MQRRATAAAVVIGLSALVAGGCAAEGEGDGDGDERSIDHEEAFDPAVAARVVATERVRQGSGIYYEGAVQFLELRRAGIDTDR